MIRIVFAYPDLLNIYGDYANIRLLCERLQGCGERVETASFSIGSYFVLFILSKIIICIYSI